MKGLSKNARAILRENGLKPKQWGLIQFDDAEIWHGDKCGCIDDRCIGFHHYGPDDCRCLPALIESRADAIKR